MQLRSDPASSVVCRTFAGPTLSDLRSLWASVRGGALATPFQTPEVLHAFRESHCRAGEGELSVTSFDDAEGAGRPFMLLPLVKYARGPLRVAGVPDMGLADQTAPVLSAAAARAPVSLHDALRSFLLSLDDCDLVDTRKIHAQICDRVNPLFGFEESVPEGGTLRLDLDDGNGACCWRGKSIYKKARSKFRRLREAGVELKETVWPVERLGLLRALAGQREDRFRQLGREDSLKRPERTAFYETLAALEASGGPFAGLSLKRGDEVIAAMVLMETAREVTAVLVSIGAARWHDCSPGMVLFAKAIERASGKGMRWFSFGTGEQDYKRRFGGETLPTRRLLLPLNARGHLFVRAREAQRTARELLQIALRRNG
ncbi:MAG: GNAT family N-acetyltransferase [Roseibium sp.]